MTNNTTKDEVLALFPDNFTNDITAADMRTYVEAVFSDSEVYVNKIATLTNMPSQNENIYEGSIMIIWGDPNPNRIGLYISKINQPLVLEDLIQISSITKEDVPFEDVHTYDYATINDVLDIPDTFTNILTLTTPYRDKGDYSIGFNAEFKFTSNNKQLFMRSRVDGGPWRDYAYAPTDTSFITPYSYDKIIPFEAGIHTLEVEMRKEDAQGVFDMVTFGLKFERIT